MKKAILFLGLLAITTISFGQTIKAPLKPGENGKIPDTAKVVKASTPNLNVSNTPIEAKLVMQFDKADAQFIVDALKAGYIAMPESDQISAKQYSHAKKAYEYLVQQIYKFYPDLIPKQ